MSEETLRVRISLETKELDEGLRKAQAKLKSFASDIESLGRDLTFRVSLPLAGAGLAAIKFASDTTESLNKARVVFGSSAADIEKWASNSARAFAMSRAEAFEAASTFGNLFVALQLNERQAAQMSMALTQLAADLASFNNVSVKDAFLALRAGLVGETEPLRRFGVNLNDATLRAEALRLGLVATTKTALEPAARAQAAYSLILQQSKTAQGDFARTSGEMANASRAALAELKELAAQFGEELLPIAKDALQVFRDLLGVFSGIPRSTRQAIIGVGALAIAIGPLIRAVGALSGAFLQYRLLTAGGGIAGALSGMGMGAGAAGGAAGALGVLGPVGAALGIGIAGRVGMGLLPKPFDRSPFEMLIGRTYGELLGFGRKPVAGAGGGISTEAAGRAGMEALTAGIAAGGGGAAGPDPALAARLRESLHSLEMARTELGAGGSDRARLQLQAPLIQQQVAELTREAEGLKHAAGSVTEEAGKYYSLQQEIVGLERELQSLQQAAVEEQRREYEAQARAYEEHRQRQWRLVGLAGDLARGQAQAMILQRQIQGDARSSAELQLEHLGPIIRDQQHALQLRAREVRDQEELVRLQQDYLGLERELLTMQLDAQRAQSERRQRLHAGQQRLADEQRAELERAHRQVLDRDREQRELAGAVVALQEARLGNIVGITPQQRAAGILPALFQQLRHALRPVAGESPLESVRRMTGIEGIKSNILENLGAKGRNAFVETPFGMAPNFDVRALREADLIVRGLEREAMAMAPVGAETLAAQAAGGVPVVFQVTVDAISPEQLRVQFETMFRELTARVFGR